MHKINLILVLTVFTCFSYHLFSNNLQVTGANLTSPNPNTNVVFVQFNMSWDNSWRDNVNWDAAWVFVKYKVSYDTMWHHATLSNNISLHNIPSGYTGDISSAGTGLFLYRNANGNGSASLNNIELRWEYGTNGVNDYDIVQVKVFAIEMVYIPQGPFYVGDGSINNNYCTFRKGSVNNNETVPFYITSENALTLGGISPSNLSSSTYCNTLYMDDFSPALTQSLPAAFPKGFNAFYIMKYEVSQGQYTDFLNTLTRHKQRSRVASDISGDAVTNTFVMSNTNSVSYRNTITCPASGNGITAPVNFSVSRPDRACNYLGWIDACAYLDWCGLRPATELEFEKICRGPYSPIEGEFAWGTSTNTTATTISGTENGTETITNSGANSNIYSNGSFTGGDGSQGPLRCGIFAKTSTNRIQSGAGFYGCMELSGNLTEMYINVGRSNCRTFTGENGDGNLSNNGNGDANWPGLSGSEITLGAGGMRGGSFYFNSMEEFDSRVSSRRSTNVPMSRNVIISFRGACSLGTLFAIKPGQK